MKILQKVKQIPKQLLNDLLCFCWIWCHYLLCFTGNAGDETAFIPSILTTLWLYCHQCTSLPLLWKYFQDARILWVSKQICSLKRGAVLVVRGTRSQQTGRWWAVPSWYWFPCTVSDANVVLTLIYSTRPGQDVSCWEIQASVRKEFSRSPDGTWTLAHLAAGPWGSTDISPVYEPFQELCIHLSSQGYEHWQACAKGQAETGGFQNLSGPQ